MSAVIIRKVANGLIAYPLTEGNAGFPNPDSISVFRDGDSIFINDYLTKAFAPKVDVPAEVAAVREILAEEGPVGP